MDASGTLSWLRPIGEIRPIRWLIEAAQRWYGERVFEMAAALAYYAVFSIAPILIIAIALAGLFLGQDAAQGQISRQIEGTTGPTVGRAIEETLQSVYRSQAGGTAALVSLLILAFSATALFTQLQSSLNAIWDVRPKSGRGLMGALRDRFGAFLAVLGASAIILATLVANMILSALTQILPPESIPGGPVVWRVLTLAVSFVLLTLAIAMLFRLLPDVKIQWSDVWVGAVVTAVLFMLGNWVISLYLQWSGAASAYGAAGSLVIILLWVYYTSQVLLFGAEFTQVYAASSGKPIEPADNAERANGEE